MTGYEYKVVPAPSKGQRAKGVKGAESRFAFALENLMNDMAQKGWEFQRSETLPSEERSGLTSTTTNWRNVLVFRRPRQAVEAAVDAPMMLEAPAPEAKPVAAVAEPAQPAEAAAPNPAPKPAPRPAAATAASMVFDLAEGDVQELDSLGQVVRNRAATIRGAEGKIEDAEELTVADDLSADEDLLDDIDLLAEDDEQIDAPAHQRSGMAAE
ncbi:hypothetical protein [Pseudoprimorskyibacter insulae]|uniref:DUF4177 domain-containing protein n=1 Tax=Pseudoprimorskyibacter insulae TaxID=1695997 RepID=A0A2R8AX56_9RHOB|nr:hypothetical protein [Pseudoprimorskyibacter insulae]SPF80602.1 hypothetical protein PRI8871_02412 [Pseudoprimorskyibacter insulae]